ALATGHDDGVLRLWDAARGDLTAALHVTPDEQPTAPVYALAFNPDGTRVAVGGADGRLSTLDLTGGEVVVSWRAGAADVRWVGYSPDGETLAALDAAGTVYVFEAGSGPLRLSYETGASGDSLRRGIPAFTPDGSVLCGIAAAGDAAFFDLTSGTTWQTIPVAAAAAGATPYALLSPNGAHIVTPGEGAALLRDAVSGDVRHRFAAADGTLPIFSPAGGTLLTSTEDGGRALVLAWDTVTGAERFWLDYASPYDTGDHCAGGQWLIDLAYGPGGERLLGVACDGSLLAWDAGTGELLASERLFGGVQWLAGESPAARIDYSRDGRYAVLVAEGVAWVWDIAALTGADSGCFTCRTR
ncbi:MAG: WD40 repeat domain-containing protein, partial [Anaerolineae bacterium]|nr:WD40 repeat domain-containing protein [Anaerolineae bacterium]